MIKIPRHPDFEKIYNGFIEQYGEKVGVQVYYAYLYNEELKEEESLESQTKTHSIDCQCGCNISDNELNTGKEFNIEDLKKYSNIIKFNNNTDSFEFVSDAIENNYNKVISSLDSMFKGEKERYKAIIERNVPNIYDIGIQESAKELSLDPAEFGDNRNKKEQIKVLTNNANLLAINLLDDIQKEIGLILTDANLNNIPFTNSEIKKEVQNVFGKKQGRLDSQIITETDRSFNTALEFGYKNSGLVVSKQWVAVIDSSTSLICQTLNGEIVPIGEPFSLGFYSPPAHPNCFHSGTKITTRNGKFNIEDIKEGDEVLTHKNRFKKVYKTMKRKTSNYYIIKLSDDKFTKLIVTGKHPVMTQNGWVNVEDLTLNDFLCQLNNVFISINNIKVVNSIDNIDVYNISVEDDETYIAEDLIVHNCRSRIVPITISEKEQ